MKRIMGVVSSWAIVLALAGAARAEELAPGLGEAERLNAAIGIGVVFPQIQSELGTSAGVQLTVGYRVWKRLVPFAGVGFTRPRVETAQPDPRLPADYSTKTAQRELTASFGVLWRFRPATARLNAYAGAAARIWMLETRTNGESDSNTFRQNDETSTRFGGALLGGAEYRLGPGAVMLELDVGGSDLPHHVTGDVATTAVSILAGYRFLLL
jgi:opacity protein-like surface antigen